MTLFQNAREVCTILIQAGYPTMFAGGCVRDRLFGVEPKDYDLATTAPPETTMVVLKNNGYSVIPVGLQHGTVGANTRGGIVEITTLRHDLSCDGRHAKVSFTEDFKADALRRDLTINGLFEDIDGQIHDHVGGLADIQNHRLRFIGSAPERIREDYLRIMRYFRFLSRLGWPPDSPAVKAIGENRNGLKQIAIERIMSELDKIFTQPFAEVAIEMADTTGCLEVLFPSYQREGLFRFSQCLKKSKPTTPDFAWFLFLWHTLPLECGKDLQALFLRLRFSRRRSRMVRGLLDFLNHRENLFITLARLIMLFEKHLVTPREFQTLFECSQEHWSPGWLEVFQKTLLRLAKAPFEMDSEILLNLPKTSRSDAVTVAKIFWYLGWCDGKTQVKNVLLGAKKYRIWLEQGHLNQPHTL